MISFAATVMSPFFTAPTATSAGMSVLMRKGSNGMGTPAGKSAADTRDQHDAGFDRKAL